LVGAEGFSYEDAAGICGCAVGTVKSRVNRARTKLAELLSDEPPNEARADAAEDDEPQSGSRTTRIASK